MAGGFTKKKKGRSSAASFSDINVTPLVDVMLVLLIVFMVTAPMMNVGVSVDLPKTSASKINDQQEAFVIIIHESGKLYIEDHEISEQDLIAQLKMMTHNNPDAKIYIRADKKLPYGKVMELMGMISQSGFNKVALMAEPLPQT